MLQDAEHSKMSNGPPTHDVDEQLKTINSLAEALKSNNPGARESLVKATRSLLQTIETPTEQIWRMLWGEPTHHVALRLAVELNLFGYLAEHGPSDIAQASSDLKCSPVLLRRICQQLAAMGTLTEPSAATFANTPMSALLAKQEYAMSVKQMEDNENPVGIKAVEFLKGIGWESPSDVRDTVFQAYNNCKGQTFFEWGMANGGDPPMTALFGMMLSAWGKGRPQWMDVGYYPVQERLLESARSGGNQVFMVDVGGNNGHDLIHFKEKWNDLPGRLLLQDVEHVVERVKADAKIEREGIEVQVHDFFTPQPVKGARAYYMHSILHDWSDEDCKRILENVVPAMEEGYSKILVQEMVVPEKDAHWELTSLDWLLLLNLGGRERTEHEWKHLVESVEVDGKRLKVTALWKHASSVDSLLEIEIA